MVRKCRKAKGIVEAGVSSSTYMQLRSRRIVYVKSEKASSVVGDDNGVSPSNLSSCCGSNEYKNNNEFIDLEEDKDGDTETSTYRRSTKRKLFENLREDDKESSKSMENNYSSEFESVAIKESSDCCCSGRIASSTAKTTTEQPTESEIDDFFAEAEKQLNEKFKKKYNFDFEKEKPLEGRYEWVKIE